MDVSIASTSPRATRVQRLIAAITAVSIRVKILVMVTGIVCALGCVVITQVRFALRGALTASLNVRGETVARDLSDRAVNLLLIDDAFGLDQLVHEAARGNADVRYAFVIDQQGQVVAHTFARGVPRRLLTANAPADGRATLRLLSSEDGIFTDVASPILRGSAGIARIGFSHRRIEETVRRTTIGLIGTVSLALAGALALALGLTHLLTRPIAELVQVVRAVGGGDLNVAARVHAADEFGELAMAFNMMTQALSRSQDEVTSRVRALEVLTATAAVLPQHTDEQQMLRDVLERLRTTLDGDAASVLLLSDGAPPWRVAAHCRIPNLAIGPGEVESLAGCVCEQMVHGMIGADVQVIAEGCRCPLGVLVTAAREPVVCATVSAGTRPLGVLCVALKPGGLLPPRDRQMLGTVGRQLGLAIENLAMGRELQVRDQRRSQWLSRVIDAQEAERIRVARELHDEAGQVLTALLLQIEGLEQTHVDDVVRRQHLADAKRLARQLFDDLHRISAELRPRALDQLGIAAALMGMLDDVRQRDGVDAEFYGPGLSGLRLPGEVQVALYRIVQEAVANIVRHARATHVSVVVEHRGAALVIVVEDNGVGFEMADAASPDGRPHLGLHGMRERAELLGGRLTVESIVGRGTSVFVELPIEEDRDSAVVS